MSSSNARIDHFLHASANWLHWSLMESHWKKDSNTPSIRLESPSSSEKKCDKVVRVVVAYVTGMIGHAFCALSKIVLFAALIFVNIGLTIHFFMCKAKGSSNEELLQKKCRLYEGLLISSLIIPVIVIDAIGIVCPPISYYAHDCFYRGPTSKALDFLGLSPSSFMNETYALLK